MKKYELHYQKNIRDIGGLKTMDGRSIKYGRLFRGGSLHKVDENDIEIIKSFHLTDIVDFRSEDEFIYRPDVRLKGVEYHNFQTIKMKDNQESRKHDDGNLLWFIDADKTGHEHLKQQYRDFVLEEDAVESFRQFFKLVSQENKNIYFHCSQGKDRAGFAAFLLQIALGVDLETAKQDYLLSNEAMKNRVEIMMEHLKDKPFYDEKYKESLLSVFSADLDYLDAAIEEVNKKHHDIISYVRNEYGVDIDRLRNIYLE